jgi:alpha-tubulin suppressor-like RCC1 family protein
MTDNKISMSFTIMKWPVQTVVGLTVLLLASAAESADVVSVWGGARGTIVLKSDGTVWTWGANFNGKLGIGIDPATLPRTSVPVEVHGAGDLSYLNSVMAIMGGEIHNVALKSDGTVWAWGWNAFGQLGDGTTNQASTPVQVGLNSVPPLTSVTMLGGRTYWNLAVKSDGTVWAWGMNQSGQLGNGTVNTLGGPQVLSPVQVNDSQAGGDIHSSLQVSCGYTYGVALAPNGTVWTWGTGPNGELGNGTTGFSYTPVQVTGLSNVTAVSSGWKHILALKSDGTVWAWGKNFNGELGDGTTANRSNAVQVLNLTNMIGVSGGDYNSAALGSDGTVWKWGLNDVGELGNGTADTKNDAHPVPSLVTIDKFGAGFSNVVMVAARDYHNIAVKSDGSVWMWGANDQGQCGDGTTNDDWRPVPVVGLGARVPLPLVVQPGTQFGNLDLNWNSATGEFFSVECSTNLSNWKLYQTNILATPPVNVMTISNTNQQRYFRLRF